MAIESQSPGLSKRACSTPASPIRKLAALAGKAKAAGNKVFHLNIGQPDILPPPSFTEGVKHFNESVLAYEASEGNLQFRHAWCDYMARIGDIRVNPSNLLITTGASEALIFLFMICCDPGDEVIVFDPTYANYMGFAAISGVKLVSILSKVEESFSLPGRAEVESKLSPRTKAILLCNPNNPTGTVYDRKDLTMLLEICREKNLFFIVDETYREFVFDGLRPLSVLEIAPDDPKVIVVDSLSKRFNLCGARLGGLISTNNAVNQAALNLAQARLSCTTLEQYAAAYMFGNISADYTDKVRDEYQARRDVLYLALQNIPGITAHKPKGAFYTVVRLPLKNAEDFARFMLSEFSFENSTTFVSPAAGFYIGNGHGEDEIRIAYVLNGADLEKAVEILGYGLKAYGRRR